MRFRTEPSSADAEHGREAATGHRDGPGFAHRDHRGTAASSCRTRTAGRGGPATDVRRRQGRDDHPSLDIFVMNARPTTAPHHAECFVRPDSSAARKARRRHEQQHQQRIRVVDAPAIAIAPAASPRAQRRGRPAAGGAERRTVA